MANKVKLQKEILLILIVELKKYIIFLFRYVKNEPTGLRKKKLSIMTSYFNFQLNSNFKL